VYTVGFRVAESEVGRVRNVTVRVKRPGLRAIHPTKYVFRSEEAKRESLLLAAWAAPELFQTGLVRAHVFPMRPVSHTRWDGMLAISFPVPLADSGGAPVRRDFGATLARGTGVAHRFSRFLRLQPNSPEVTSTPTVTFLEPVTLRPGTYTLTAVLSTPGRADPHAVEVDVEVPEIPQRELFLVGPVLGRPAGANLVVTGGPGTGEDAIGEENSFEPLLVYQLDEPIDLAAFSQACLVGKGGRRAGRPRAVSVERSLRGLGGEALGSLPDVDLTLGGQSPIACHSLVDVLPISALPDGQYEFEVRLHGRSGDDSVERVRFAVGHGR
jgi:hypothetical protein